MPVSFIALLFGFLVTARDDIVCGQHAANKDKCSLHRHQEEEKSVVKCNGTITSKGSSYFRRSGSVPRELVVYNAPGPGYDPTYLKNFTMLKRHSIINSTISHFIHNFPLHHHLHVLNLTRLQLTIIRVELILDLKALKVLDLSYNKIHHLNGVTLKVLGKLSHLYLKGDSWNCGNDLKWILSKKNSSVARKIVDINEMICSEAKFSDKPVVQVMSFIKGVESECPKNRDKYCTCCLENIVRSKSSPTYLVPIISVNCSGLQWKKMPEQLPLNTTTLYLQHNQIKDLRPLIANGAYKSVTDVYLDHNLIENLNILEQGDWLSRFRVFSLRDNRLENLPVHVFHNSFERNFFVAEMYLGNNPWSCDCAFAPAFKELIVHYIRLIKDAHTISCKEVPGDPNSKRLIRSLSVNDVCHEPSELWLGPIDILNIVLASLIVLVLSNLLYNYWRFKTTGKLPWIVLKMP